ncbi:hypothetical protein PanWU01x14_292240 [Parasponia andersonii]|uniref:Uncharacterized protein n=1 Tax=Parasponia andersonii TaxID=3476 RepID=A0A2P5AX57_PARAD|nr:hypothetical protein PanWU01x14_292240 [Parasponia andersonii]
MVLMNSVTTLVELEVELQMNYTAKPNIGRKPLLLESCVVGTTLSYCVAPAKGDLPSNSPAEFCFTYPNVIISFFGSTVTSYCD